MHWATSYNIVGNVLGQAGYNAVYQASGNSYQSAIYKLGYPNVGNMSYSGSGSNPADNSFDTNVLASVIMHGNYDYTGASTKWDPTISDHNIPASLYRSASPSWWPAGVPWPCIGSDLSPLVSANPAKARYLLLTANQPPPPTNLHTQ
jgi:hypothetical protein